MSLGTDNVPFTMPVTPANTANNNGGGWGGDWTAWIIIFLIFAWGGFGNGGWGNGGGAGTQGAITRSDLCSEFSFNDLQNGVRNINDAVNLGFANLNSTICHQQYDTAMQTNAIQAAVNGGFQALNSTICQQQYDTAQQINGVNNNIMTAANAANVVALQNANALQAQLAQCCCDQKAATENLRFTIANEDCQTRQTINDGFRTQIENCNANTRAILDRLTAQEIAAKDAQIASLNQQLFRADLSASQAAQTNQIVNRLNPTPVPAYPAASPCGLGNWSPSVLANGYGYNGGCGCCCNG